MPLYNAPNPGLIATPAYNIPKEFGNIQVPNPIQYPSQQIPIPHQIPIQMPVQAQIPQMPVQSFYGQIPMQGNPPQIAGQPFLLNNQMQDPNQPNQYQYLKKFIQRFKFLIFL